MALPDRDKTFALENCRDLLRKLEREIERFTAARDDVEARIDHAFNIVVTAWHLKNYRSSAQMRLDAGIMPR